MTIRKKLGNWFAPKLKAMYGSSTPSRHSIVKLASLPETDLNKTATKLELCGRLSKTLSDMVSQERSIALRASIKDWGNVEQHKRTFAAKIAEADNDLIAQHYRDRGDVENNFDELKNQWGWAGFTTQDRKRCQIMGRIIALVYNWWTIFMRLGIPGKHAEAI